METKEKTTITVKAEINAPVTKVWACWNDPKHIVNWNFASDDWHAPSASNDLQVGGKLTCRMEAKDGSVGFDFVGVYKQITPHQLISYRIEDGREVIITFSSAGSQTLVTESFEAEHVHPTELQQAGWQSILNNFKNYVEHAN